MSTVPAPAPEGDEREALVVEIASYWWSHNSGETETWDELDTDEREAVIENSAAEFAADAVLAAGFRRAPARIERTERTEADRYLDEQS